MNKKDSTRDKILDIVLKHISETGTHQITIREIAALANVNSAAISYYFGSKDELIHEACKYYYDLGSIYFRQLEANDLEPPEKLKRFFINYTGHMLKFPGFLKAQLSQYISGNGFQPYVEDWVKKNLTLLSAAIGEVTGETDREALYLRAMQFLSNMAYPFLLNEYSSSIAGIDFADSGLREKYIDIMLENMKGAKK